MRRIEPRDRGAVNTRSRRRRRWALGAALAVGLVFGGPAAWGQEPGGVEDGLRVFLDCQNLRCDFDHLRREIAWVDWVRDREVASVHVLGVQEGTGGGGRQVSLAFIGRGRFAGTIDTIQFRTGVTDTEAERRAALARHLALGLVSFVAGTPLGEQLTVLYDAPVGVVTPVEDPWNFWVFEIEAGGGVSGEERQRSVNVRGGIDARRVTEAWKLLIFTNGFHRRSEFDVDEDSTVISTRTEFGIFTLSAWSLGPHWSIGGVLDAEQSTFDNFDLSLETGAVVEFSIFPYSESTRRSVTIQYAAGVGVFDYQAPTVFEETAEVRPIHQLGMNIGIQQPWGSIRGGFEARQFLHDPALHRIDVSGGVSLRIVRGVRLNLSGSVARVKDQINLPAGDLTSEEILLQQRLLGTGFEFRTNISFSYTFGSIFNNVVNPRF